MHLCQRDGKQEESMKQAIVILKRALHDILDNPVVALQISVLPLLIATFVGQHFLEQALQAQRGFLLIRGQFVWWLWALGLAGVFLPILWMAVGWHRFVLLGERPWPVAPKLHIGRILAYGWATVLVTLIAAILALIVCVLIGVVVGIGLKLSGFALPSALRTLGSLLATLLVAFVLMFQSAALVSAACGRRMSIGEAMEFGDINTEAIFWLTLASLGLAWGLEQVTGLLHAQGLVLGGYELVSNWFLALFNVGVVTALVDESGLDVSNPPLPPDAPSPIMAE
jgi:hypothetical protein